MKETSSEVLSQVKTRRRDRYFEYNSRSGLVLSTKTREEANRTLFDLLEERYQAGRRGCYRTLAGAKVHFTR